MKHVETEFVFHRRRQPSSRDETRETFTLGTPPLGGARDVSHQRVEPFHVSPAGPSPTASVAQPPQPETSPASKIANGGLLRVGPEVCSRQKQIPKPEVCPAAGQIRKGRILVPGDSGVQNEERRAP